MTFAGEMKNDGNSYRSQPTGGKSIKLSHY
jgi:hypothetical protein